MTYLPSWICPVHIPVAPLATTEFTACQQPEAERVQLSRSIEVQAQVLKHGPARGLQTAQRMQHVPLKGDVQDSVPPVEVAEVAETARAQRQERTQTDHRVTMHRL